MTLSQVSTGLREACYVALVFHSIIENGNGTGKLPPWKWPPEFYQGYSTEAWTRLALVDFRSTIFENELEPTSPGFKDVDPLAYKWLPLLIATNHPVLNTLHLPNLSNYLTSPDLPDRQWEAIEGYAFCFSAALIHQVTTLVETVASTPLDRNDYIQPMTLPDYPCVIAGPFFLEILRCRKRMTFSDGPIIDNNTWQPPPTLKTLPFSSVLGLETFIPFSDGIQFPLRHLPTMASKEFLEDGIWVGYYAYCAMNGPAPTGSLLIDRPMRDISFRVRVPLSEEGFLEVNGTGRDNIGVFELSGILTTARGKLGMTKAYVGQHSFPWDASITPFGILGTWGQPMSGFHGGWIWLWKQTWGDRSLLNSIVPVAPTE
ncbi:hypothetical protein DL96DRAFT_1630542 [Flagelloscypha sp. PMI_526]|nr:hypothetical protein DL96DRAFT_1630542 [Flagelloscypha sp. PMI_526]